jgi:hypothetical protein
MNAWLVAYLATLLVVAVLGAMGVLKVELKRPTPSQRQPRTRNRRADGPTSGPPMTMPPAADGSADYEQPKTAPDPWAPGDDEPPF